MLSPSADKSSGLSTYETIIISPWRHLINHHQTDEWVWFQHRLDFQRTNRKSATTNSLFIILSATRRRLLVIKALAPHLRSLSRTAQTSCAAVCAAERCRAARACGARRGRPRGSSGRTVPCPPRSSPSTCTAAKVSGTKVNVVARVQQQQNGKQTRNPTNVWFRFVCIRISAGSFHSRAKRMNNKNHFSWNWRHVDNTVL